MGKSKSYTNDEVLNLSQLLKSYNLYLKMTEYITKNIETVFGTVVKYCRKGKQEGQDGPGSLT